MEDSVSRATNFERSSSARGTCISSASQEKKVNQPSFVLVCRCITVKQTAEAVGLGWHFRKPPRLEEGQSTALFCFDLV